MPVSLQAFLSEVIEQYGFNGKATLNVLAVRRSTYEIEMTVGIHDSVRMFIVDGDMVFDISPDEDADQ